MGVAREVQGGSSDCSHHSLYVDSLPRFLTRGALLRPAAMPCTFVSMLSIAVMDEADLLGDRIAIMSRGTLRVVGSSLFLKGRFGIGYHLVVALSEARQRDAVMQVVRTHIPLAAVEESPAAGVNELCMVLPLGSISKFATLFAELEDRSSELCIVDYGVSVTSLEEVFLRLAEAVDAAEKSASPDSNARHRASSTGRHGHTGTDVDIAALGKSSGGVAAGVSVGDRSTSRGLTPLDVELGDVAGSGHGSAVHTGASLKSILQALSSRSVTAASFGSQIKTQLWRRYKQATRDRRGLFLQCVFPLIFVAISFVFRSLNNIDSSTSLVTFPMSPSQFLGQPQQVSLPYFVNASKPLPDWAVTVTGILSSYWPNDVTAGVPVPAPLAPASMGRTDVERAVLDQSYAAGAFVFNKRDPLDFSNDAFQLTIMVNTSFVNSAPILLSVWNSALLRDAEQSNATVTSGYEPFIRPRKRPVAAAAAAVAAVPVLLHHHQYTCCRGGCGRGAVSSA
jgi:hypothetical protein